MLSSIVGLTPYALVVAIPGWLFFHWWYRRLQRFEKTHSRSLKIRFAAVLMLWLIATQLFCAAIVVAAVGLGHGGDSKDVGLAAVVIFGSDGSVGAILSLWLSGGLRIGASKVSSPLFDSREKTEIVSSSAPAT